MDRNPVRLRSIRHSGSPTTNCIAEDDDSGAGLAPALTVDLVAFATYVLVTTQCCDGTTPEAAMSYTNTVTGPGDVVLGQFVLPTTSGPTTATTATSTTTTTTSTAPSTTTTAPSVTTTSTPAAPSTTTPVGSGTLARTGSPLGPVTFVGLLLVAGGLGTLLAARRA